MAVAVRRAPSPEVATRGDLRADLVALRARSKALMNQARLVSQLAARLEERFDDYERNPQPQEAQDEQREEGTG